MQNQFRDAEEYARQQYMIGTGHVDNMKNTINTGVNNMASQGMAMQNQMTSMPGQMISGATNVMNPRLANLGNDLAPRAMEYINDLGTNHGTNYNPQIMNTMNQISQGAMNGL